MSTAEAVDRIETFFGVLEGDSLTVRKADGEHKLMVADVREVISELEAMAVLSAEAEAERLENLRIVAELQDYVDSADEEQDAPEALQVIDDLRRILNGEVVDDDLRAAVTRQLDALGVDYPNGAASAILDAIGETLAARQGIVPDEVLVDTAEDAPRVLRRVDPSDLPQPSFNPNPHVPDVPASRFFGESTGQRYDAGDLNS